VVAGHAFMMRQRRQPPEGMLGHAGKVQPEHPGLAGRALLVEGAGRSLFNGLRDALDDHRLDPGRQEDRRQPGGHPFERLPRRGQQPLASSVVVGRQEAGVAVQRADALTDRPLRQTLGGEALVDPGEQVLDLRKARFVELGRGVIDRGVGAQGRGVIGVAVGKPPYARRVHCAGSQGRQGVELA